MPPGRDQDVDVRNGDLAGVLEEASVLLELDAARAEAWASGLLSEWPDHEALLDALRASSDPRALAVAVALCPMLPAACDVARSLEAAGLTPPPYAPHVGTARAVRAWSITDRYDSGASIVVEYEHADGVRHDVLVELDGDRAIDLLVGEPGVVDAAREEAERPLEVAAIPTADAHERIRAALQATAAAAKTATATDLPLTDAFLLNHALVASRVGAPIDLPVPMAVPDRPARQPRPADPEGDAFALETLRAALDIAGPVPPELAAPAAAAFRERLAAGDPEHRALVAEAGLDDVATVPDAELLVRVAAAYVAPGPRVGMSPAAADAVDSLEWADWLGAVVELVRSGPGADASPEQLVRNINRCPEVTTSIPTRDMPAVASAFAAAMPAWRVTGAITDDERLSELGLWLLPRALVFAWGGGYRDG
ncbi:MAG TPA: hypothetical protein VF183_14255 [Acidimicrobiales bacterium]